MRSKFTKAEIDKLLKNIAICVDTREQRNEHIIKYFKDNGFNYIIEKVQSGDYTACILSNEETIPLGINRNMYFDDLVIERKANIDEVAGNLSKNDRARFEEEFAMLKGRKIKVLLYIEEETMEEALNKLPSKDRTEVKELLVKIEKYIQVQPLGYDKKLRFHKYRSQYKPKSLYGSIKDFEATYDFQARPVSKDIIGSEIYHTFYYYIRKKLMGK